jgi:hypothetical protein
MQFDIYRDILNFVDDKSLSYFEYKSGDYISDDELFILFTFIKGKIHSTGGKFYQLEKASGNVNKNNERNIITDSKGNQQLCFVISTHVYAYLQSDLPKFTLGNRYFRFYFYPLQINRICLD